MSVAVEDRLTAAAVGAVRSAIGDAGGNEVFLLGGLDEQQRVGAVRVIARGNRQAVPALLQVPRPGEVVIHNHPSGNLTPSDADLAVAGALGNNAVAVYIVNNPVSQIYVVVEPHVGGRTAELPSDKTAALLAPGGPIAKRLAGFERRPQQMQMLEAVVAAFNDNATLTVEAGTGTGKSLAYLLPAIAWSQLNRERIIVSTHTINLQEQLVLKDLPFLTTQPGLQCTAALVKGRGNYLCCRKAAQVEEQGLVLIEDDLQRELKELLAWARRTTDGSLSDLAVPPRREVWEQVVSENDNCLRTRCPYYSTCFFYEARRAAAKADIIVANHHLLMADLALREEIGTYTQNAVLPPARRIIIDEAHHLEDVATNYFGTHLSYASVERAFTRLRSAKHDAKGLLPALIMALESIEPAADAAVATGAVRWIEQRLLPRRMSLLVDAEQCFTELRTGLEELLGDRRTPGVDQKIRVVPETRALPYWHELEKWLVRLGTSLGDFAADFDGVCERIDQLSDGVEKQVLFLNTELRALQGRIAAFGEALLQFIEEDDEICRWIELRQRARSGSSLAFHAAPVRWRRCSARRSSSNSRPWCSRPRRWPSAGVSSTCTSGSG